MSSSRVAEPITPAVFYQISRLCFDHHAYHDCLLKQAKFTYLCHHFLLIKLQDQPTNVVFDEQTKPNLNLAPQHVQKHWFGAPLYKKKQEHPAFHTGRIYFSYETTDWEGAEGQIQSFQHCLIVHVFIMNLTIPFFMQHSKCHIFVVNQVHGVKKHICISLNFKIYQPRCDQAQVLYKML